MSPRQVTATEFKVTVFSEVPFRDNITSLHKFLDWQRNELCHVTVERTDERRLDAKTAADELRAKDLTPAIFGINNDGSELDA